MDFVDYMLWKAGVLIVIAFCIGWARGAKKRGRPKK